MVPSMHHSPSGLTHASWLYLLLAKEPKSHRRRSLGTGRHQRHHSNGEEEALEMAWPCTYQKRDRHPYAALTWAPPGKSGRGRPLGTWRRIIEAEMEEAGKNWSEIRWLAQDRPEWRSFVDALRSIGGQEDWVSE